MFGPFLGQKNDCLVLIIVTENKRLEEMNSQLIMVSMSSKTSQESIDKIRRSHIGKKHTDETKEKLRKINLGKKQSLESKEKNRQAMLGKPKSKESIEKSAISRTGLKRSIESKEKIKLSHQVEVEQWSIEGNYIKTHPSIKHAKEETGCNDISKCCRGKYKKSGGFIWKYKDVKYSE